MMKRAEHRIIVAFAALLIPLAGCEVVIFPPGLSDSFEEDFSLSTPFDDVGSLRIEWRNGQVSVRVDPDAVELTAGGTKTVVAGGDGEAEAAMEDFAIRLFIEATTPSQLILQFDAPEFEAGVLYTADVEVVVPGGVELSINHANGDVMVNSNSESTEVELTNGDVTMTDNVGDILVDLRNGGVVVTGQQGDATVSTNNGNVEVSSDGGNVDVQVGTGNITVGADPGTNGVVIAQTDVGSVAIAVDGDTAASVELVGTIGSVSAVWEGFTAVDDLAVTPAGGITATLNGGGGTILGRAGVGSVDFRAR